MAPVLENMASEKIYVEYATRSPARGGKLPTHVLAHYRYDLVFLVPPWPEIYEVNEDRRHGFERALRDYERVRTAYLQAGYDPVVLPRRTVIARADFVLAKVPSIAVDLEACLQLGLDYVNRHSRTSIRRNINYSGNGRFRSGSLNIREARKLPLFIEPTALGPSKSRDHGCAPLPSPQNSPTTPIRSRLFEWPP